MNLSLPPNSPDSLSHLFQKPFHVFPNSYFAIRRTVGFNNPSPLLIPTPYRPFFPDTPSSPSSPLLIILFIQTPSQTRGGVQVLGTAPSDYTFFMGHMAALFFPSPPLLRPNPLDLPFYLAMGVICDCFCFFLGVGLFPLLFCPHPTTVRSSTSFFTQPVYHHCLLCPCFGPPPLQKIGLCHPFDLFFFLDCFDVGSLELRAYFPSFAFCQVERVLTLVLIQDQTQTPWLFPSVGPPARRPFTTEELTDTTFPSSVVVCI